MATNFSSIPILDYSLTTNPATKPQFLADLRTAATQVGFFYLQHHTVPRAALDAVTALCPRFFALPAAEKERIRMVHSPHFFGYSRFGAELTKGRTKTSARFVQPEAQQYLRTCERNSANLIELYPHIPYARHHRLK